MGVYFRDTNRRAMAPTPSSIKAMGPPMVSMLRFADKSMSAGGVSFWDVISTTN